MGLVDFLLGCGWGTEGGCHLVVFIFFLCFCIFLSHVLTPFIGVARVWMGDRGWVSSCSFYFFLVLLYFFASRSHSFYWCG